MLVVSRKRGEKIICRHAGVEIIVEFIEQRGDKVRIGVHAPECVTIYREEVQQIIDESAREDIGSKTERATDGK